MTRSDEPAPRAEPDATAPETTGPPSARASTVRSLRNKNFRRYLTGQVISKTGNWFQVTAEIWLILEITGSATAVGLHSVLRFGPLTVLGIPGGLLTDRYDHVRLFTATQIISALIAVVLAIVSFSASPSLLLVYSLVFVRGVVFAVDNPLRRTLVRDLVSDESLGNAVSLNSSASTAARSLGPAISGIVIATTGVAWSFTINAVSFLPVFVTLALLDRSTMRPVPAVSRQRGQIREGLTYARRTRRIRRTLLMVAMLGLYPLNWAVVLPVYATKTFGGSASMYGFMTSLMAVGAFVGAALIARQTTVVGAHFRILGALMAGAFILVASAPWLVMALAALAVLGASITTFQIAANTRLQLEADDTKSGRVLALYSVALIGTRPIGGFITGLVVDSGGPRLAFLASAAVVIVAVGTMAFGTRSRAKLDPRRWRAWPR